MTARDLTVHGTVPEPMVASLARQLAPYGTLDEVLAWGRTRSPAVGVSAIVTQDEYTHDVTMPVAAGSFLVCGVT